MLKKEIRVIGIDDGPFFQFRKGKVLIIGTIFRGSLCMEGVITTTAKVDGNDATQKIAKMIIKSRFAKQLQCIFLGGITVGGFNVIDINELFQLTKIPVIAVIRGKPDVETIHQTLHNLGMQKKIKLMNLPEPTKLGKIYVQYVGIPLERVKEFLKITTTRSYIPEPLRAAHIMAAGIVKGESRGRA